MGNKKYIEQIVPIATKKKLNVYNLFFYVGLKGTF